MLESIACPECLATRGFTQVEPNTYYCPYHKGLFKWVDVNRVTVDNSDYFCSCGHRIEFQCQLCKRGVCGECDVIEAQNRLVEQDALRSSSRREFYETYGRVIVSVRGFGYLEAIHHTKIWVITGERVEIVQISDPVIGPFLGLGDIWPQLAADPDALRHVCCVCVGKKVTLTAEAIAAGRLCEHPGCGATPAERCRCCGSAFCTHHFKDSADMVKRSSLQREEWMRNRRPSNPDERIYRAPNPVGFCAMCVDESRMVAREKIDALLAENPFGRIFGLERKVSKMVEEFERTPRPCRRDRLFDQQATSLGSDPERGPVRSRAYVSLANRDFMISTYKILDERDRVSPGPA